VAAQVAGTYGTTAITIQWDPAPSGNLLPIPTYRLYKLSIENDLDEGTNFALADTIGGAGR